MKVYMFQAVRLSIIRSFPLYTQQWYMSYRFADSLRAASSVHSHIERQICNLYVNAPTQESKTLGSLNFIHSTNISLCIKKKNGVTRSMHIFYTHCRVQARLVSQRYANLWASIWKQCPLCIGLGVSFAFRL